IFGVLGAPAATLPLAILGKSKLTPAAVRRNESRPSLLRQVGRVPRCRARQRERGKCQSLGARGNYPLSVLRRHSAQAQSTLLQLLMRGLPAAPWTGGGGTCYVVMSF